MADEIAGAGIRIDTKDVERGAAQLDVLASKGEKVEAALGKVESASARAGKTLAGLGQANGLKALGDDADATASGMGKLGRESQTVSAAFSAQAGKIKDALSSISAMNAAVNALSESEVKYLSKLADEVAQLGLSREARAKYIAQSRGMSESAQQIAAAFGKQIDAAKQANDASAGVNNLTRSMGGAESAIERVATVMTGIGAAYAAVKVPSAVIGSFYELSTAILAVQADLDKFRIGFSVSVGGLQAARELEFVRDMSRELGLELSSTADAYRRFALSASDSSLGSEKVREIFLSVSKAAAVMGLSASDAQGVFFALGQMISKGTVASEELRGQLGERLPGALQIAAKAMGVTTSELGKMLEQGQVIADDFLPKFAIALDQKFSRATSDSSKSAQASLNRIEGAWTQLKQTVVESGFGSFAAGQVNILSDAMTRMSQDMQAAKASGDGWFGQMAAGFGSLLGFLNPLNAIAYSVRDLNKALEENQRVLADPGAGFYARASAGSNVDEIGKKLSAINSAQPYRDAFERGTTAEMLRQSAEAKAAAEAAEEAVNKFVSAKGNLSKNDEKLAEQTKRLAEFANAVKGLTNDSALYARALDRLNSDLRNINEKYRDKGASGGQRAQNRDAQRAAEELAAARASAAGFTADYTEKLAQYQDWLSKTLITETEYVALVEKLIAAQPVARDLLKQWTAETKSASEAEAALVKVRRESYDAQVKALADTEELIARLKDEELGYTLSAEALARRTLQRQLDNDAAEIARLAGFYELSLTQEQIAKIDEQIEALKRLSAQRLATAGARDDARRSDAMADAAKEAERAWLRTADEINRGLTDSLFRAAEAGKGAFETLRDSLKGMFANLVLRPLVQGSIGALGGLLGLTGSASAATAGGSGGGALGTLGSLASLGGALGSFGTGFASGLTAWGAGGSVTGLLSTGSALFSGGLASGLGTIAGALGPIALGVAAIMAFMKDGGGPKTGGSFSTTGERLFSPADRDDLARTIGEATVSSASQLAARFGGAIGGTLSIGFDQDPQGTAGTRVASRVIGADGRVLLDNSASRRVDDDNLDQELAAEAQRVMLAALQGANLQDGFADIFGRLDPATAAPDAIANLLLLAESLYQLGEATRDLPGAMGQIAELSATAREQLVGLAGGLDNLLQQQASFAQNFLSAQQRFDIADAQLSREFERITGGSLSDFTAGKTEQQIRDTFAQLVLGLDLTSEHGPAAYAALLAFQGPFSAFIDQMEALGKTVPDARRAIQAEMDDLSAVFGDLSTPVETVADKIARFTGEIDDLESALADILGTAEQSPLDRLRATVGLRNSIQGVRDSLADRRQEATLAGFEARGDTQGAIDYLRGIEAQLWDTLGTAVDDGSTAQKIVDVFLRRMGLEAQAAAGGSDLQLIEDARNLRIDTLRAEIDSLETISRISDDIRDTLLDLRTGSLSALSPRDQLAAARAAYEGTLAAARGGDVEALGRLSGLASGFLSEQQAFSASGGDYGSVFARVIADLSGVGASLEGADSALGVARLQLEELQKLPSAISQSVVDNSAEVLDGLAVIDERFGGVIDTLNGSIDAQVAAQLEAVNEMKGMREDLRAEFQKAQDRWEALGAQLQQANAALAQQNAEALAGS